MTLTCRLTRWPHGAVSIIFVAMACAPAPAQEPAEIGEAAAPAVPPTEAIETQPAVPVIDFATWHAHFRQQALNQGISAQTLDIALASVVPNATVMERDMHQPEFAKPIWDYLDGILSEERIATGREMLARHAAIFNAVEQKYGVDRHYIAAIWGIESNFGRIMGDFNVFEALATLAWQGRRTDYGNRELVSALRILQAGNKTRDGMISSWAGAMGQNQFIPSSYLNFAKDGDGDGHIDIWDSLPDVFSSIASYLANSKWKTGYRWGREVRLPEGFDFGLTDYTTKKPLSEWRALGVMTTDGAALPVADLDASIIVPAGHRGPAFLIYDNFRAVLSYNTATSYALAVSYLAQRFAGGPAITARWPREDAPLALADRQRIQDLLNVLGHNAGDLDGILGAQTRDAVRSFQRANNLVPDGYANHMLLQQLETQASVAAVQDNSQDAPAETATP